MRLSGDVAAVVTGAASGLGEGTARALADAGARVAIFDMNADAGAAVAKDIGGVFCEVNVADEASVVAGFERARAAHGQERVLINCAGVGPAMKTVSRGKAHDMGQFEKVIAINLLGSFRCASKAAEGMATLAPVTQAGERGVIVCTASVAAYDGQIGQAAYAASKGGIVGMTLPVARDLANLGVRVCTVAPGLFDTPLLHSLPDDIKASLAAQVPFPSRFGTAAEYAGLVRHIVENEMLNGEVIRLDGAIRMGPK